MSANIPGTIGIAQAVRELTSEQAERALEAFDDPMRPGGRINPFDNWWDGPLARAYGKRGALADRILDARLGGAAWLEGDEYEVAANAVEITTEAAIEIEEAFAWPPHREELRQALRARADQGDDHE